MTPWEENAILAQQRYLARLNGFVCPKRGERVGMVEKTCCGGKGAEMVDAYRCAIRSEPVTLRWDCRKCPDAPWNVKMPISKGEVAVVIASLSEGHRLTSTAASIRRDCPEAVIIGVDDASPVPEPAEGLDIQLRNPVRHGLAVSRARGILAALENPKVNVCIVMDAHMALDYEDCRAAWGRENLGRVPDTLDAAWAIPGKIRALAETAREKPAAIAYAGCNGHHACGSAWEGALLRGRWRGRMGQEPVIQTSAMMGAFYAIPRWFAEKVGGWPQLPGYWGFDEEAISLLAVALGYRIFCHQGIQTWHLFRGPSTGHTPPFTVPSAKLLVNAAAVMRLVFDDDEYARRKAAMLAGQTFDERPVTFDEAIFRAVETPPFIDYVREVQKGFVLDTPGILQELDRRRAADPQY